LIKIGEKTHEIEYPKAVNNKQSKEKYHTLRSLFFSQYVVFQIIIKIKKSLKNYSFSFQLLHG
jgi:hypothetical protein